MLRLILALLAIWLVLTVLGFVIKGLLWLAVIGIILFAVTRVTTHPVRRRPRSTAITCRRTSPDPPAM